MTPWQLVSPQVAIGLFVVSWRYGIRDLELACVLSERPPGLIVVKSAFIKRRYLMIPAKCSR